MTQPHVQVRQDLHRLGFEHLYDHKVLMLDTASPEDCRCLELACAGYDQVIIFDHDVRRT